MSGVFISTYLADQILNHVTLNGTWTPPSAIYWQLHTDYPGPLGTIAISAGNATRKVASYNASTANAATIAAALGPWANGGAGESLFYASAWDALTGGNLLWIKQLPAPFGWSLGDIYSPSSATLSFLQIAA